MKTSKWTMNTALAVSAVLASWTLSPSAMEAIQPRFQAMAAEVPQFAQQSLSSARIPNSPTAPPGANLNHLGTSVFPHNDNLCSVDHTDVPGQCSVDAATARRCSSFSSTSQECSVFNLGAGGGNLRCSSQGRANGLCSVLQPRSTGPNGSVCSARTIPTTQTIACSVISEGGPKQACSAENNPHRFAPDSCSTHNDNADCSVITGGQAFRNFCSVGRRPAASTSTCSVYEFDEPGGRCSVLPGNFGVCTSLLGAPAGSCSSHTLVGTSNCSVIGGANGDPCTQ